MVKGLALTPGQTSNFKLSSSEVIACSRTIIHIQGAQDTGKASLRPYLKAYISLLKNATKQMFNSISNECSAPLLGTCITVEWPVNHQGCQPVH